MSDEKKPQSPGPQSSRPQSSRPIQPAGGEGGGGSKWLLGAAAAIVLIGGGLIAWQNFGPNQASRTDIAYNDQNYSEPLRAGPMERGQSGDTGALGADDSAVAAPAAEPRPAATPQRRAAASQRAEAIPQETIGITPVSATTQNDDEIVVPGIRRPIWTRTPSARRLSAMYPERALERGREGEASLHCVVGQRGALDCEPISETPARAGFGAAAVRVARTYRHATTLADGANAVGSPVNLRVVFRIAEDNRRRG